MAQFATEDYKRYMETQGEDPVEYIFRLFETADVVILGERDHRDITQYEFIHKIVSDRRFIEQIGHVYTETGVVNMTESANRVIQGTYPTEEDFRQALLQHLRDEDYNFIWEKTNRSIFLDSLYRINKLLPVNRKITIGCTDIAFDWYNTTDPNRYRKWLYRNTVFQKRGKQDVRDKEMATNFLRQYKRQQPLNGKRKALLITNQPHAIDSKFNKNEAYIIRRSLGKDKVKIVCLNWFIMLENGAYGTSAEQVELIDDGKWDAAFEMTGCRPVGFDIKNSPFGLCPSWYWNDGSLWQDQADGFVFFTPYHQFTTVIGIEGYLDDNCREEMQRRLNLLYSAGETPSNDLNEWIPYCNTVRRVQPYPQETKKHMDKQMSKWMPHP